MREERIYTHLNQELPSIMMVERVVTDGSLNHVP